MHRASTQKQVKIGALIAVLGWISLGWTMGIATNMNEIIWYGKSANPFTMSAKEVSGSNPWRPDFIEDMKPYLSMRNLNWNKTNNPEREWAEKGFDWHKNGWAGRVQKHDPEQRPMAYEWQIDACNRSMCDYWLTIPHVVDDEYIRNLAVLTKQLLNPKLKVWIEWSNECWNGSFTQYAYCVKNGQALKMPGKDQNYVGAYYYGTQSARTWTIFKEVFGNQATQRCIYVLAGWITSAPLNAAMYSGSQDKKYNPGGLKPPYFAVATYGPKDGCSKQDKIASCAKGMATLLQQTGMKLITYEGGSSTMCSLDQFANNFIAELVKNNFFIFNNFTHSGTSWGAKREIGEPYNKSGKYHALWNYMLQTGQWNPQTQTKDFFDERGKVKFEPFATADINSNVRKFSATGMRAGMIDGVEPTLYDLRGRRFSRCGAGTGTIEATAGIYLVRSVIDAQGVAKKVMLNP